MKNYLKTMLFLALALCCSSFVQAQEWEETLVTIKNRFRAENYIKAENQKLVASTIKYGEKNNNKWIIYPIDNQYFRIAKHGSPHHFLHTERGPLECTPVPANYWTSHWKRVAVGGGYYRIENRFRKGQVLNMEKGPLESSIVPEGYWTSHWSFGDAHPPQVIPVDGDNVTIRHINRAEKLGYSQVYFSFKCTAEEDGWKAIKIFDRHDDVHNFETEKGDGVKQSSSFDITYDTFPKKIKVEFWKAKAFGIHTHIKTIYLDRLYLRGYETTFTWD